MTKRILRRGHCLARAAAGDSNCTVTAAVLANTLGYYGQFRPRVAEALAAGLAPLEKQLQVRMWLCLKPMQPEFQCMLAAHCRFAGTSCSQEYGIQGK